MLALHGLSWVVGVLVPLVILAGVSDWLFHLDLRDQGRVSAALAGRCSGSRTSGSSGRWSSGLTIWTLRFASRSGGRD